LTKTYLTLSLKNIGEQVHDDVKSVESNILMMIRNGQIYAKINQKDGMVSFYENPDQYNSNSTLNYLDTNIHHIIELHNIVRTLDETITTSQQYVQKMVQSERGKFGPGTNEDFDITDPADFRG